MYSLTLVLNTNLEEKDRGEVLDSITKNFDKVLKTDLWGVRSLAYPIKHQDKGFYAYYEFDAAPEKIPVLDRQIRLNEKVIRYLLIKVKKQKLIKSKANRPSDAKEAEVKPEEKIQPAEEVKEEKKIKRVIKKAK